ncbi:gamma-glutamylcyclotransferase family protein [Streptomyces sp. HPF1205]|uniref:gamma-glutamylcyclotransferase family protein n=1 Tax=Streptomyces sp. HPF1205 TaxID=2873262 RepID=UPI001CED9CF4|nr:gamma-glutamylcyclotransferase family protein [Streptomyces sp. HPF1205]
MTPWHRRAEAVLTTHRLPFFVYGTLLSGERNHHLLAGRTATWTPAELTGALLFHATSRPYPYPYAVPDPAGAAVVRGEVAAVSEELYEDVLRELDLLENFSAGRNDNHYERVAVRVRAESSRIDAWVYFAADRIARDLLVSGVRVPYGDWRRRAAR